MNRLLTGIATAVATVTCAAAATPVKVKTIRAAQPPHCLAAEQWRAALKYAAVNLFDGDPATTWRLCPRAEREPGYALDVRFAGPVELDAVRIDLVAGARAPARLDVAFYNTALSRRFPIHYAEMSLPAGRTTHELSLDGPLKWNPMLLNDLGFRERRRKAGYSETEVPRPLAVDGITLVFRKLAPGAGPVEIADLTLLRDEEALPVEGLDAARKRYIDFLARGLRHILADRYLVAEDRVLCFAKGGKLREHTPEDWKAGKVDGGKILGTWRIEAGRLELRSRHKFEPVSYFIDDAPFKVELLSKPVAGTYRVATRPPKAEGSKGPAPTLGADPTGEPPPLLDDEPPPPAKDGPKIPIP